MDTRLRPMILGALFLLGIIGISFSAIFVKWSEAPVSVIAMNRLLLTNLLLLPFMGRYWPEIRKLSLKSWGHLGWSGLALGLHFLLWMGSLRLTSVASSTAILTMEPIFVAVGSYVLFRYRLPRLSMASMAIAILGAFLIAWGDFDVSPAAFQGDLLSLIGAFSVAVHMIIGKQLRYHISAFVYSYFVFFIAALTLIGYNLIVGHSLVLYSSKEWGIFLLLAVVSTLLGHYLFNWMLKYVSATAVSMAVLGEPLGATLLAWMLLNEGITLIQGMACTLLVSGVWLFMRSQLSSERLER